VRDAQLSISADRGVPCPATADRGAGRALETVDVRASNANSSTATTTTTTTGQL